MQQLFLNELTNSIVVSHSSFASFPILYLLELSLYTICSCSETEKAIAAHQHQGVGTQESKSITQSPLTINSPAHMKSAVYEN